MANKEQTSAKDEASAKVTTRRNPSERVSAGGVFHIRALGPTGNVKFTEEANNIVVNQGLNYLRDSALLGGTQITTWYLGLTATDPSFAAGDTATAGGHAGWTEVTSYSEANRQTWSGATSAAGAANNATSVASYSINASDGFGGVFMISKNVKGSASNGQTLYSGVAFSQNRALASGDTLEVTYTHTMSDAT